MIERAGRRASWESIPRHVREAVDGIAGSPVVAVTNTTGGFSPGPAARCELADGSRVFVKITGTELNPVSPKLHRREAAVMAKLPAAVPAPRLIGVYDDGEWVALVIEHVDGRMPTAPLSGADIEAVLAAVAALVEVGTPAPPGIAAAGTNEAASRRPHRWPLIATTLTGADSGLDPWSLRHLDALVELEAPWMAAVAGDSLQHGDLRADNVLITADITYLVDWPSAAAGAPWLDLVSLLPALHIDGAPPPAELFERHPVARDADADRVNAYLAALLGYFTHESLLPAPVGLPTLRPFQHAQAVICREWLSQRLGWT